MTMTTDQVDILRRTSRTRALSRISGARYGRGHRYGKRFSAAQESDLLTYAAILSDEDILGWRDTGPGILGWIRTHQPALKGGMTVTTEAGKYVIGKAVWNEGMRGHFIRMFSITGPQDVEIMVRKIEEEAIAAERERIKAEAEGAITFNWQLGVTDVVDSVLRIIDGETP
jgi:hypothetical protein